MLFRNVQKPSRYIEILSVYSSLWCMTLSISEKSCWRGVSSQFSQRQYLPKRYKTTPTFSTRNETLCTYIYILGRQLWVWRKKKEKMLEIQNWKRKYLMKPKVVTEDMICWLVHQHVNALYNTMLNSPAVCSSAWL